MPRLESLVGALDEAYLSAPAFNAQEARAEAFGARAPNDFKHEHQWTDSEDTRNGVFKIDLASHGWLDNGHTLDKHVGKTDEQLAQRQRDQGNPPTPSWPHGKPSVSAASTFETMEQAQRLTQYTIDQNSDEIKAWLTGPPPPSNSDRPENRAWSRNREPPHGSYSGRKWMTASSYGWTSRIASRMAATSCSSQTDSIRHSAPYATSPTSPW